MMAKGRHFQAKELVWVYSPSSKERSCLNWTVIGWGLVKYWSGWVRWCTSSRCHPEGERSCSTETG